MSMTVIFCAGSSVAALFAWVVARRGSALGLVDYPNWRSSHETPTPKSGGVGIVVAFVGAALYLHISPWFWGPTAAMAVLGFCDDLWELSARLRIALQIALAITLVFFLIAPPAAIVILPLAVVYIVGTANFFNFMDGINGIAALTGCAAFLLLGIFAGFFAAEQAILPLMLSVVGACLGFLPFNFPRPTVFMGDVGSLFLGTLFAGCVLSLSSGAQDFLLMNAFMFPFYADAVSTLLIRWCKGEKLMQGHRQHLYQLLTNEIGLSHSRVTLMYVACQLVGGIGALALVGGPWWAQSFLGLGMVAFFATVSMRVRRIAHVSMAD